MTALDADGLIGEVKKLRGKKKPLTVAEMKQLKEEHAASVVPLHSGDKARRPILRSVDALRRLPEVGLLRSGDVHE